MGSKDSHIAELFLCTNACVSGSIVALSKALGQLPGLEKVYVTFQESWSIENYLLDVVTLPCVQEMCLSAFDAPGNLAVVPPILRFLKLPRAASLTVQDPSPFFPHLPTLPTAPFGEHLQNYVELPDLQIHTTRVSGELIFQSPSQAVFTYRTGALQYFGRECQLWGSLPICSVERVTAVLEDPTFGGEDGWLLGLFKKLGTLEHLELGGDCGQVLRSLRRGIVRGAMRVNIKTLIVRGGEYAKSQAFKFGRFKDRLDPRQMTVTYIPDPEAHEGLAPGPDAENSSDDEVRGGGLGEDEQDEDDGGGEQEEAADKS